ncbi:MAG: polyphosphate polymerase domain-containing protein [Rikenellaceae bacterium]
MPLDELINKFEPISLEQMDQVKLMNRTDRKFWCKASLLPTLLESVCNDYYLLEINGKRNLPYSTTYFDTTEDEMYNNHHRGKKNRYKIRRRNYVSTQSSFLEIKFKSNKGRTIKQRIDSDYQSNEFNTEDKIFIKNNTPYSCDQLHFVLMNGFLRMMLVSKSFNERCTIDTNLRFESSSSSASLEDLAIIEIKSEGHGFSQLISALSNKRLKPSGFSKYCIGRSMIDNTLKINRFKNKHRQINKSCGL